MRVFGDQWTTIDSFPIAMNGCGTRQFRIAWRSIGRPVIEAFAFFHAIGSQLVIDERAPMPLPSGSMWLSGCEEPVFISDDDQIADLVVELKVYEPAVGAVNN